MHRLFYLIFALSYLPLHVGAEGIRFVHDDSRGVSRAYAGFLTPCGGGFLRCLKSPNGQGTALRNCRVKDGRAGAFSNQRIQPSAVLAIKDTQQIRQDIARLGRHQEMSGDDEPCAFGCLIWDDDDLDENDDISQAKHTMEAYSLPWADHITGFMYNLEGSMVQTLQGWNMLIAGLAPPERRLLGNFNLGTTERSETTAVSTHAATYEQKLMTHLNEMNALLIDRVLRIEDDAQWKQIAEKDGIRVWSASLGEDISVWPHGLGPSKGSTKSKFEAILARAVIDASPDDIFNLFGKNELVAEYNEFCNEITDVMVLDEYTKVTWGASGNIGPFCARDFVTRCFLKKFKAGSNDLGMRFNVDTWVAGNLAEAMPCKQEQESGKSKSYVRMEILLGGTIGRPVDGGRKTEYTILCHTNPGGTADSLIGAKIMNSISSNGPITHIKAVQKMVEKRGMQSQS